MHVSSNLRLLIKTSNVPLLTFHFLSLFEEDNENEFHLCWLVPPNLPPSSLLSLGMASDVKPDDKKYSLT